MSYVSDDPNFEFIKLDVTARNDMENIFRDKQFDVVVNLVAQVCVRHSIEALEKYVYSDLTGFGSVLEGSQNKFLDELCVETGISANTIEN